MICKLDFFILANPDVIIEFGSETFECKATVATGEERKQLWNYAAEREYGVDFQAKTPHQLPLVTFQRKKIDVKV